MLKTPNFKFRSNERLLRDAGFAKGREFLVLKPGTHLKGTGRQLAREIRLASALVPVVIAAVGAIAFPIPFVTPGRKDEKIPGGLLAVRPASRRRLAYSLLDYLSPAGHKLIRMNPQFPKNGPLFASATYAAGNVILMNKEAATHLENTRKFAVIGKVGRVKTQILMRRRG